MGIQDIDRNTILEKGMRGYILEYLDIDGNTRYRWEYNIREGNARIYLVILGYRWENKDRDGITQNGKGVRNYKWE